MPRKRAAVAVDLDLGEFRRDGEGAAHGHRGSSTCCMMLPQSGTAERVATILVADGAGIVVADPDAGDEFGGVTDEPGVAVTLGIAGHAGEAGVEAVVAW